MGRELISELMSVAQRKIQTQGQFLADAGALEDIADEVIDEFRHDGLLTDDADIAGLRAELIGRLRDDLKQ